MSATLDGARVTRAPRRRAADRERRAAPFRSRPATSGAIPGRGSRTRSRARRSRRSTARPARSSSSCRGRARSGASPRRWRRAIRRADVDIAPLYGALDARAQDLAVAPAPPGRRKVVLATSIAETSLTIEGVRVVIDSGLMRVPRLRARHRPDAARNRARQQGQRRPAARPRRARRAGRLLSPVGGGGDRRPPALRRAGNPVGRSLRLPARLRASGATPIRRGSPFSIRRRARALAEARALLVCDRRDRRRGPHDRRGPGDRAPRAAAAARPHGRRRRAGAATRERRARSPSC